jgi:MFS family permease
MLQLLRGNRDLRHLFLGQIVNYCGDWFAYVAFVGIVQDASDRKLLVTLILVSQMLPTFLMSPIAGACADRFDRRRIIVAVALAQAVAALGLTTVGPGNLWLGYVCIIAIAALGSFVGPASSAAVPNLVQTPEELSAANAISGSLWGMMMAVGAALGGIFAELFGRDAAFVANSISFAAAAGFVAMIRTPMQQHTTSATIGAPAPKRPPFRPIGDMTEAVRFARRDPVMMALMASKATYGFGAGMVALLAVLATREFGGADGATGMLIAARGAGAAIGPMIGFRLVGSSLARLLTMCGAASLVYGACYFLAGQSPSIWIAAALILIAHLGGGAQWTLSSTGLQRRAPDHVRGRILAGDFALVTLTLSIGTTIAGITADAIGPRSTTAVFASVSIICGIGYLWFSRKVRVRLAADEISAAVATVP